MTVPTTEPTEVNAGDTWQWRREDLADDYPADDGWTLTYYLVGAAGAHNFVATADGEAFAISVLAATTATYAAGEYSWGAYVSKGADRFEVARGTLTIKPNLATVGAVDQRSHARKTLAAIEAVIEKRATKDQESYTINGRSLSRTSIADLLKLRDRYRFLVQQEEDAEGLARGVGTGGMIVTRFGRV